jgi:hypothetical protein
VVGLLPVGLLPVGRLSVDKLLLLSNVVQTEGGLFAVLFYVEGSADDGRTVCLRGTGVKTVK